MYVTKTLIVKLWGKQKDLSQIEAIRYGIEHEKDAIAEYEENFGEVLKNGLFISRNYPMFCASPDGIQGDKIIEVKCPFSIRKYHPFEIETMDKERRKKLFYKKVNGQLCLKKTWAYYHQVQFQLLVTGYKVCVFLI